MSIKTEELKQSWLIQRLKKPIVKNGVLSELSSAFAFGGGYKNGGLTDEAMSLLRPIFSFDYMGSAEFEFGAIPKCFSSMFTKKQQYDTSTITINQTDVYIIGLKEKMDLIIERVIHFSKHPYGYKEELGLLKAVGFDKYYPKDKYNVFGWLELDNEFMFFTDKEMFEKSAKTIFDINL